MVRFSSDGVTTAEQKPFKLDFSHDPDESVFYNSNSSEIGYSVGFLAKPGSVNKVIIDDGEIQREVPLSLSGNIAKTTLDSDLMSDFKDGTLILKYFTNDNLVYQSNFL